MNRYGLRSDGISDRMLARVLDAADACIARDGFDGTTMISVARQAEVSRQTIHRLFETRDQMVKALGLRQTERLLELVTPRIMRLPTARERLVELAVQWVRGLPVGERASAAFRSEEVRLRVATIVARSPEILPMTAEHIGKFVADAPDVGDLRYPNDLQGVARLLVDVGAGFRRGTAGGMSAPAMRRYLHRYFVPAVFIDPD